jgi:uncharacterized protein
MSEPGGAAGAFAGRWRRRSTRALRRVSGPALAALAPLAIASMAWAQSGAVQPPPPAADVKAAMDKADAGEPTELTRLADQGRPDAQYYAGIMYIFGRGRIARDAPRGCAYEEKASTSQAEAMHLLGLCYLNGWGGVKDTAKAKDAFSRAADMGSVKAKCALGQVLMSEPGKAERGLQLCRDAAIAGDADAQLAVGDAYYQGGTVKADRAEARKWYAMAAGQNNPQAARRLGEMYAAGDGGPKDTKKALELWMTAEAAGDPLVSILVADQLFTDLTGRTPGPGKYTFRGGIPVADIEAIETWYREALQRDPRPDVKKRAEFAVTVLEGFKSATKSVPAR